MGIEQGKPVVRLFQTKRGLTGQDMLVTDGQVVRAIPILEREAPAGRVHTIEADIIYHLTTIPKEHLAATLVLDSPAFGDTTDVLIDSASPQLQGIDSIKAEIARTRRLVDNTTAILAKVQLMYATGRNGE